MTFSGVLKGEGLRQRKKLFIFILGIIFVACALYYFVPGYRGLQTLNVENPTIFAKLKAIFSTNLLLSTGGNYALTGYGAGLFIFLGAFWIGDDIESKMVWNFAVARKNLISIFLAKIVSIIIYIAIIHVITILTLIFTSTVVFNIPLACPNFAAGIGNFILNTAIMSVYALVGVFFALFAKSSAFGGFIGFVLFIIMGLISVIPNAMIISKYSLHTASYEIQKYTFPGTTEQFTYILGDIPQKIESSPAVTIIIFLVYAVLLLLLDYYLYQKRARE